jgi:hypothetical protein
VTCATREFRDVIGWNATKVHTGFVLTFAGIPETGGFCPEPEAGFKKRLGLSWFCLEKIEHLFSLLQFYEAV